MPPIATSDERPWSHWYGVSQPRLWLSRADQPLVVLLRCAKLYDIEASMVRKHRIYLPALYVSLQVRKAFPRHYLLRYRRDANPLRITYLHLKDVGVFVAASLRHQLLPLRGYVWQQAGPCLSSYAFACSGEDRGTVQEPLQSVKPHSRIAICRPLGTHTLNTKNAAHLCAPSFRFGCPKFLAPSYCRILFL